MKCHGPSQLGDGQTSDWDKWTKEGPVELEKRIAALRDSLGKSSGEERRRTADNLAVCQEALAHDTLPIRNAIPRNLRLGIYRGGRRPLDLYRRAFSGINGTPMPAAPGVIKPEQVWN